ncbi:helix-turn-helix domain-containing protein [Pseudogulbenkiania sp. MAI-1]|uniref:helix-turn-helix domain-containing protein n=1 Tax=Pseudogulbenkiania sp. MAI-1 TaxID=990370 RepID=UPI00045EA0D9|nr:helix-turn-helix domain-containing protein [Pseudogulbenkiania sp. MAI-1]
MTSDKLAIVAFDGISLFHLSVPTLIFGEDREASGVPRHTLHVCAERPGPLTSSTGLVIDIPHGLEPLADADVIIVPSWNRPERPAPSALTEALRHAHARGAKLVGLCLGAFVLADTGLLDGRRATTHWGWNDMFARRFPQVRLEPDVLYIDEDDVMTSAGTVAALDGCLHLLRRRLGADVANRVARRLVMPPHRQGGQAQYVEQPLPARPRDEKLAEVLDWARARLALPLSLDTLANAALMSRRTFTRRFREATGMTVSQWLTAERLALAQRLLESTDLPIENVAEAAGFGSPLSLRQHFRTQFGTTPAGYRRTFRHLA